MITITLQRNDSKVSSDTVSYTQDTITLNGQEYSFPQGSDLLFISPHDQIIDPKRDVDGVLHAIVIKQYNSADRMVMEHCDKDGCYGACQGQDISIARTRSKPIIAEIHQEEIKERTVSELITQKGNCVSILKEQYIDADLDDNEELKMELKAQIQELKKEIMILKDNISNESDH
ncbi:MAG: hypothetical protein ACRCWI_07690 [Brevinema sp.]